jgi:hypothetical protein
MSSGYSFLREEIYQVLAICGDRDILLFVTAVVDILTGGDAKQAFKVPAEVALAGEAGLDRDLDERDALGEEKFGAGDAKLGLVEVWRKTNLGAEDVIEVEGTQIGKLGKLGERDVFRVVFVQVGFDALNGGMLLIVW